jgi:hypothetical protein
MAGVMMKLFRWFQKVPARPSVNSQRTGQRPASTKKKPGGKDPVGRPPVAAATDPMRQARHAAAIAEAEVVKISRKHLGTLMASSPRQRIAHLADPELTTVDRTELEHSVRSALPRSAPVNASQSSLPSYFRRLLRTCGYKCAVATVLLAAGGLLAGMAQHRRPDRGHKLHLDDRLAPAQPVDLARCMEGRPPDDRDAAAQWKGSPSILAERPWLRDDRGRRELATRQQF